MVNKNIGNGIVVVKHRTYPIAWTGEIAQHIYDKNVNNESTAVLYIEAQQCVSRGMILVLGEKHYFALLEDGEYIVVTKFSIVNDYAKINTSNKYKSTIDKQINALMARNKKNSNKGIGKVKDKKEKYTYREITPEDFDHDANVSFQRDYTEHELDVLFKGLNKHFVIQVKKQ